MNTLELFGTQSFDVITTFDLFAHVSDPIAFLREIARFARHSAFLIIMTPDVHHVLRYAARAAQCQPMQLTVLFWRRGLQLVLADAGYADIEIGAASKTLTMDYFAGQIEMYLPALVKAYRGPAKAIPAAG